MSALDLGVGLEIERLPLLEQRPQPLERSPRPTRSGRVPRRSARLAAVMTMALR